MKDTPESHVLFVTYHLPTDDEPGAVRPWVEARLLRDAGYSVTVVTSAVHYMTGQFVGPGRGWCREEVRDGIRILRVWTISDYRRSILRRMINYTFFALFAALAVLLKVRKRVHCIFAATDPIFITPSLILLSAIKRAPIVLDERDLFPDTAVALGVVREGWLTRLVFSMQQFVRHRAASLVAATPGIRRRLVQYGHNPSRVHLMLNADPYMAGQPRLAEIEAIAQYRSQYRCLVGYAGTLGLADATGILIQAAAELKSRDDVGFLIVGGGERVAEYINQANELQTRHLKFLGTLPRATARAILAVCDIGIQALSPDPYFGVTLTSKTFDYFSVGIPVVFAGEGDTADLLRESGAGITVTPGNASEMAAAVTRLADDKALRDQMGLAGRNWHAKHITVSNYLRAIQAAIPLPASSTPMLRTSRKLRDETPARSEMAFRVED